MKERSHKKTILIITGGLLLLTTLIFLNLILSKVGKYYVNRTLERNLDSYIGHIDDLHVNIFRGKYTIDKLILYKKKEKTKPLLRIGELDSTINLENIFKGKLGLELELYNSDINIIDNDKSENGKHKDQLGYQEETNEHWSNIFNTIVPLDINHLNAENININFWYPNSNKRPFNLKFDHIQSLDILAPENYENNQSPVKAMGSIDQSTEFKFIGSVDFTKDTYPHDLKFKLDQFKLNSLNPLLLNYIPVDITKGTFEVYSELKGDLSQAKGEADIFVNDLEIIEISQDFVSVKHFFVEVIAGVVNWVIDMATTDGFVVQIPYEIEEGTFNIKTEDKSINEIIHDQKGFKLQVSTIKRK